MTTYRVSSCFNLWISSSLSLQHVLEEASERTLQVVHDIIMSQLVKIAVFSLLDSTHSLTYDRAQNADHMHKQCSTQEKWANLCNSHLASSTFVCCSSVHIAPADFWGFNLYTHEQAQVVMKHCCVRNSQQYCLIHAC